VKRSAYYIRDDRTERYAEKLADGLSMMEAGRAIGLTKGETVATMRKVRRELGEQAR
jgi:hypothetical protein